MSEPLMPNQADTPATALGPTALVLGVISVAPAFALFPSLALAFLMFPWAVIASALAVTFGAVGIRYARRGIGRVWMAVAGTTLGAIGLVGTTTLFWVLVPTAP
ncbi:hypothetical protein ACIBVL_37065 [Streptomyces sp. NPDC049687]|uniref:hypothetical protein n=1 Tax=Streptomyces sp. NPDC049687 TaxID=3365596 RepID=UPI0037AE92EF